MAHLTRRNLLSAAALPLLAAPSSIRLVIIGDDIGAVHSIGEGTILAYQNGIERSANLIVPGPWLLEAVEQFKNNPGLGVGIHLCLTSEWTQVKWRMLTPMPSLVDAHGYPPATSAAFRAKAINLTEAERELRAQIELGKKLVPRAAWVSAHMGAATSSPALRELTLRLADEYKMPLQDTMPDIRWLRGVYKANTMAAEKIAGMLAAIEGLAPGTNVFLDHPATDTPEMRRVFHPGSERVAEERSGVLKAWTDPSVLAAIKRRNIELISVADAFKIAKP